MVELEKSVPGRGGGVTCVVTVCIDQADRADQTDQTDHTDQTGHHTMDVTDPQSAGVPYHYRTGDNIAHSWDDCFPSRLSRKR